MTRDQEHKLKAMDLPEREELAVRKIIELLNQELGDDDDTKRRALATLNHYMQSEGFFG